MFEKALERKDSERRPFLWQYTEESECIHYTLVIRVYGDQGLQSPAVCLFSYLSLSGFRIEGLQLIYSGEKQGNVTV